MEVNPTPDQEALIRAAIDAGRFATAEDALREALALWEERERELVLAEFRGTLDEAEAELSRGEAVDLGETSAQTLTERIMERCRARLASER